MYNIKEQLYYFLSIIFMTRNTLIHSSINTSFGYRILTFPLHQNFWPQGSVDYIKTISKYSITCLASNIHHNILTIIILLLPITRYIITLNVYWLPAYFEICDACLMEGPLCSCLYHALWHLFALLLRPSLTVPLPQITIHYTTCWTQTPATQNCQLRTKP